MDENLPLGLAVLWIIFFGGGGFDWTGLPQTLCNKLGETNQLSGCKSSSVFERRLKGLFGGWGMGSGFPWACLLGEYSAPGKLFDKSAPRSFDDVPFLMVISSIKNCNEIEV